MRMLPLYACAGVLVVVPVGTAAMLALFPAGLRSIPLWFWVFWFLFSVWIALDAPVRVESLIPPGRLHRSPLYGRRAMLLGLGNVLCSIATLIYLGWWS